MGVPCLSADRESPALRYPEKCCIRSNSIVLFTNLHYDRKRVDTDFGEVAELAEGSRLLSGYRVKSPVPGSNPGLSAGVRIPEVCGPLSLRCHSHTLRRLNGRLSAPPVVTVGHLW